jgi:hypothetical protein
MEMQTSSSHAAIEQEVLQLNASSRNMTPISNRMKDDGKGNPSAAWHKTPCPTGDNSNFRILEILFSLGSPYVTTVALTA